MILLKSMATGVRWLSFLSIFMLLVSSLGCTSDRYRRPNILLVTVDSLAFNSFSCTELEGGPGGSGFQTLCEESVRFTHAYTPSVLTQPSLVSIFSGQWPFQHGARHNGGAVIADGVPNVNLRAIEQGYRTSFFSGGPPIFRRSAVSRGIEHFDDNIPWFNGVFLRGGEAIVSSFQNWVSQVRRAPFFATLYFADLQWFDVPLMSGGVPTDRSPRGRWHILDKALFNLFTFLKSERLWNNTVVVVVGTNGSGRPERPGEVDGFNIYSENTRVALFIKGLSKERDLIPNWKVDENVSLVDVGATLFDYIGAKKEDRLGDRDFKVESLRESLEGGGEKASDRQADRVIPMESGWSSWRLGGGTRFSFRKGFWLYFPEGSGRAYNSLADQIEVNPISSAETKSWSEMLPYFSRFSGETVRSKESLFSLKARVASEVWAESANRPARSELLRRAVGGENDKQLAGWAAMVCLEVGDWAQLMELGNRFHRAEWELVGANQLGKRTAKVAGCAALDPLNCDDRLLRLARAWIRSGLETSEGQVYLEELVKGVAQEYRKRRAGILNWLNGLVWDVNTENPSGPLNVELYLSLQDHKRAFAILKQRLAVHGF